jgi:hypothetical protein
LLKKSLLVRYGEPRQHGIMRKQIAEFVHGLPGFASVARAWLFLL